MNLDSCTPGQRDERDARGRPAARCPPGRARARRSRSRSASPTHSCPKSGPAAGGIDEVLVITFTEKAAAEIKARVKRTLRAEGMCEEALKVGNRRLDIHHPRRLRAPFLPDARAGAGAGPGVRHRGRRGARRPPWPRASTRRSAPTTTSSSAGRYRGAVRRVPGALGTALGALGGVDAADAARQGRGPEGRARGASPSGAGAGAAGSIGARPPASCCWRTRTWRARSEQAGKSAAAERARVQPYRGPGGALGVHRRAAGRLPARPRRGRGRRVRVSAEDVRAAPT